MTTNRLLRLAAALTGAVLLATAPQLASGSPDGMRFGAVSQPRAGESYQSALLRAEATAGRTYDVVRDFPRWDSPFPDSFHTWLQGSGRTLILSVKSRRLNGQTVLWQSLVDAQPGSALYDDMVRWADRLRDYAVPIYFTFNHEPESKASSTMGDASQFIAAWRKFHDIVVARGATNVRFMWIMTDYAFMVGPDARNYGPKWYPGDGYVDAMGIDAYNWFTCRTGINTPWMSLEQIIRPFRDFGALHPTKELWLTEWASAEDPANPTRKAQWYAAAQALFKRSDYAQFVGVSAFDAKGPDSCNWYPDSTTSSAGAFRTMATDPFYDGGTPPPPPPATTEISFVASASSNANVTNHSVQVPGTVQSGDTLLLYFTANTAPTSTSVPAGWTQVRSANLSTALSRVWVRTATAGDAGSTVTVSNSSLTKGDLTVAAYRGPPGTPIDVSAVNAQASTTTQYVAPSVTPTRAGDWVVVYWADKSSTNTGHAIPASLTRRRTTTGTGGGHITATLADTNAAVALTPTGTYVATGSVASSQAISYTIALRLP
ncbi:glycosyl hydrolase [Nocardioides sp. SLBN-35]|uniref:glycosyl hydrolase n=1 Tax=Nocardioides sp. SLBN-35 TaxID=2768445 RepID=UPI001154DC5D|nr:glycosyl hydrolase [Nocardioides sp. SLBN-35]TQK71614.1 glycosyl hydrolase family 26 [Nocardioides sp. SLBN-35]